MTAVPKVQLNLTLDDMLLSPDSAPNTGVGVRSIIMTAIADNVEDEKCVVAQYRTTAAQKEEFKAHLNAHDKNSIPIEWVIDIADESNGEYLPLQRDKISSRINYSIRMVLWNGLSFR